MIDLMGLRWSWCAQPLALWLEAGGEVRAAPGGREGDVWHLLDVSGPAFVLKRWTDAPLSIAARQCSFLLAALERSLPVPAVGGWGADNHGKPVLAMEYEGMPLALPSREHLEKAAVALAGIHATPIEPLREIVPVETGIDAFLDRLFPANAGYEDIAAGVAQARYTIIDWDIGLAHGDFHLGNIVLHDDTMTVVDWSDVSLSDRRYDLAWALLLLAVYTGPDASRHFLGAYREHAPVPWPDDELRPFEALAGLRWLLLARTAPVSVERERLAVALEWVQDRLGAPAPYAP